jgi:hypothetical protein
MLDFKGPQVHLDLHLELALEVRWHSPRVPAGATSAILEFVRHGRVAREHATRPFAKDEEPEQDSRMGLPYDHTAPPLRLRRPLQGVPGLILFGLDRAEVDVHQDLELAREIVGYSPRVPAGATSAILEITLGDHLARLVEDPQPRGRDGRSILLDDRPVLLAGLTLQDQPDRHLAVRHPLHVG